MDADRTHRPQHRRKGARRKPDARPDARNAALHALARVLDEGAPLEPALEEAPGFRALEVRDRAFARKLAATCLRRAGEIDALIDACLAKPLPAKARTVRHVLALGIAQLRFMDTPAHAAVDTAVALVQSAGLGGHKGLVNAVLRRIGREGDALCASADTPRLNTPDWLWRMLETAYGPDAARAIAAAHMTEPPLDLTLRDPAEAGQWAEALGARALATGSLRLEQAGAIAALPGFDEGAWWVQDAAAALPARLIPAPAGKRVADMCAAPGGKTLQLAAAGAHVTAIDSAAERLRLVERNLARTGLSADLICADARSWRPDALFDAVLLDAPCTATGTQRRHPDIARTRQSGDVLGAVALQDELLAAAAHAVAPGGYLVYAVCALGPAEGEDRIAHFLETHPDFARDPVAAAETGAPAETVTEDGALRTLPCHMADEGGMDGFYAARLRRFREAGS